MEGPGACCARVPGNLRAAVARCSSESGAVMYLVLIGQRPPGASAFDMVGAHASVAWSETTALSWSFVLPALVRPASLRKGVTYSIGATAKVALVHFLKRWRGLYPSHLTLLLFDDVSGTGEGCSRRRFSPVVSATAGVL